MGDASNTSPISTKYSIALALMAPALSGARRSAGAQARARTRAGSALTGDLAQRTARALAAGCDIALHCKGAADEMVMVASAAGSMGEETRARARAALARRGGGKPVDIPAIEAAISVLTQGREPRFG
jgi:hypothetical protein